MQIPGSLEVSTHASVRRRQGCDNISQGVISFNSRLREEATFLLLLPVEATRGFNSRLREEATGADLSSSEGCFVFQLTPP